MKLTASLIHYIPVEYKGKKTHKPPKLVSNYIPVNIMQRYNHSSDQSFNVTLLLFHAEDKGKMTYK